LRLISSQGPTSVGSSLSDFYLKMEAIPTPQTTLSAKTDKLKNFVYVFYHAISLQLFKVQVIFVKLPEVLSQCHISVIVA
jgi:hypothetical protein